MTIRANETSALAEAAEQMARANERYHERFDEETAAWKRYQRTRWGKHYEEWLKLSQRVADAQRDVLAAAAHHRRLLRRERDLAGAGS